jgi:hypothetical protein
MNRQRCHPGELKIIDRYCGSHTGCIVGTCSGTPWDAAHKSYHKHWQYESHFVAFYGLHVTPSFLLLPTVRADRLRNVP